MIGATPAWLADTLAAAMIATAAYCAGRIVFARLRRRRTERDVDAVHVAMGLAMAGMFVPRLDVLPGGAWGKGGWTAVFCAAAAWFAARAWLAARAGARRQAAHHVPHLVACAAMVYMVLAPIGAAMGAGASGAGMVGMGAGTGASAGAIRFPTLALALIVFLIGYAVVVADRIPLGGGARLAADGASDAGVSTGGGAGWHGRVAAGTDRRVQSAGPDAARNTVGQARDAAASDCSGPGGVIAPRAALCCHLAMSVAMAYMLVVLL